MTRLIAAGAAHSDVLAAMHRAAVPAPECWGRDAMGLQLGVLGGFGWIDERGGFILARVAADESELLMLAVARPSRRLGVARGLLRQAMATATSRGARAMFLEVSAMNDAARALYVQSGFAAVGRRRRYYADGADALVLRCLLRPADGSAPAQ